MNKVILSGRLGADPELKTAGSSHVLRCRVATNERRKDKDGNWSDHTEWHAVIIWGKRAEALAKLLSKGSQLIVEGQLRTSSWEKDGQKRYKTEVHAQDVELVKGERRAEAAPAVSPYASDALDMNMDDLPF
jgi:single-strand DNA-binding protein